MESLPEQPSQNDCCGSGCSPCVFEVYDKQVEAFNKGKTGTEQRLLVYFRHDLLSPLKYNAFELLDIIKVNLSSRIYTMKPYILNSENEDTNKYGQKNHAISSNSIEGILPYTPGQHIIMKNIKTHTETPPSFVSRCYTPVSVAQHEENCLMKLLIKLYDGGQMSSFISQLEIGDVVFLRGPFGDFQHTKNSKYLMICAGTGFAPMYSIIKAVLQDEEDETIIRLCFACTSLDDLFFREDIRKFSKFWNFRARIFLSNESAIRLQKEVKHKEDICLQKITFDAVKEESFPDESTVLICGSETFNSDMQNYAEQCGNTSIFVF